MGTESLSQVEFSVSRYRVPDQSPIEWRFNRGPSGWRFSSSDCILSDSHQTIGECIAASGACAYESGIGLYIRTDGLVSPFEFLPALQEWTLSDNLNHDVPDWSNHGELGHIAELLASCAWLELDPARLIRFDDGFIGVRESLRSVPKSERHLLVFLETDPPRPKFFDEWAWVSMDNGWAISTYNIGEIVPGLVGELFYVDEIETLAVWPLPCSHPDGLYDAMVSWVSQSIASTPDLSGYNLVVEGDTVSAIFPPDYELGGEASGWLGPTVMGSQESD